MKTVYEFSYLGNFYYTETKPDPGIYSGKGVYPVRVIANLSGRNSLDKRTIAKHIGIASKLLTVIREKK